MHHGLAAISDVALILAFLGSTSILPKKCFAARAISCLFSGESTATKVQKTQPGWLLREMDSGDARFEPAQRSVCAHPENSSCN